jgi:hypothetical protein
MERIYIFCRSEENQSKGENVMAQRSTRGGGTATMEPPAELQRQIDEVQRKRDEHLQEAAKADEILVGIFNRLSADLRSRGKITEDRRPQRSPSGIRETAGTGRILGLIQELAEDGVARTADVVKAAKKRLHIKYPHSSFQSLQQAGAIKLGTPARGRITLVAK